MKIVDVPLSTFTTNPGEYYGLFFDLLLPDEETGEFNVKDIAFTKVGGHTLFDDRFQDSSAGVTYAWTSTFASNSETNAIFGFGGDIHIRTISTGGSVRPFVHF